MRFNGIGYRAHDPRWAFQPLFGDGAAIYGGRFNRRGQRALYLSLTPITALKEITQGLVRKMDPCTLCSYEVDCEPIADLTAESHRRRLRISLSAMRCAWFVEAASKRTPQSWAIADQLETAGYAGLLTPSFAVGAQVSDINLVLWRWGDELPTRVTVYDPNEKLPKDSSSWERQPER